MRTFLQSALAVAMAASLSTPALAQQIGTVAAANAVLDGTPPDAPRRTLSIGQRVISNERIRSSETGSGQLLFLDHTTLSIAPNSDIVLDRYVYDPERDAGEIAASMTKGVLRFIGGRITDKTEATITTPVATIGIRGGMAMIEVCDRTVPDCPEGVSVVHLAGQFTRITAMGQTLNLSRSSARATINPGSAPAYTGIADSKELSRLMTMLEGTGTGSGGSPSSQDVEARLATVAPVGSGERGGPALSPVSTGGQETASIGTFDARASNMEAIDSVAGDSAAACIMEIETDEGETVDTTVDADQTFDVQVERGSTFPDASDFEGQSVISDPTDGLDLSDLPKTVDQPDPVDVSDLPALTDTQDFTAPTDILDVAAPPDAPILSELNETPEFTGPVDTPDFPDLAEMDDFPDPIDPPEMNDPIDMYDYADPVQSPEFSDLAEIPDQSDIADVIFISETSDLSDGDAQGGLLQ